MQSAEPSRKRGECFYFKMLSKSKKKIYHSCNEIRFRECFHEYFMYGDLKDRHVKACFMQEDILGALWKIYLKKEYLKVDTWEDIEEILDSLTEEQVHWKGGADGKHGADIPKI